MKKLILPALVLGAMVSFTSCKKDYTCDCDITQKSTGYGESTTVTSETSATQNLKKKDAEEWCDELDETSTTMTSGDFTVTTDYSCTLK